MLMPDKRTALAAGNGSKRGANIQNALVNDEMSMRAKIGGGVGTRRMPANSQFDCHGIGCLGARLFP